MKPIRVRRGAGSDLGDSEFPGERGAKSCEREEVDLAGLVARVTE